MTQSLTINFSAPLPIFPLPNCVLMPHATIPLHIFEPRYRQMTTDAIDGPGVIAMALFEGDDWKRDYEGSPPIRPIVCVGYITRHEKTDDGRYHLLLQGVCRARVLREVEHAPYRRALVEPTEVEPTMEIDLAEPRGTLDKLLADPLLGELATVSAISKWATVDVPTTVLIDLAIMAICDDAEQRYRMLSETQVRLRSQWLEDRLRQTRKTLEIARRFEPGEAENFASRN